MKVTDIMNRYVEFIDPDALISEAAVMMGELDVGALPAGTPEHLEGILTDRDILYRVVARGLDCSVVRVREVLSRPVVFCTEDDTVRTAMDMMAAHHIRRLPVRDARDVVTGWITLADLSRKLLVEGDVLQTSLRALTESES